MPWTGTADLFAAGQATITTSRGTVRAWLTRPSWHRKGALRTRSADYNGQTREGWSSLGRGDESKLRREVQDYLTWAIIELADD